MKLSVFTVARVCVTAIFIVEPAFIFHLSLPLSNLEARLCLALTHVYRQSPTLDWCTAKHVLAGFHCAEETDDGSDPGHARAGSAAVIGADIERAGRADSDLRVWRG